jgi:hypothetical protein
VSRHTGTADYLTGVQSNAAGGHTGATENFLLVHYVALGSGKQGVTVNATGAAAKD